MNGRDVVVYLVDSQRSEIAFALLDRLEMYLESKAELTAFESDFLDRLRKFYEM